MSLKVKLSKKGYSKREFAFNLHTVLLNTLMGHPEFVDIDKAKIVSILREPEFKYGHARVASPDLIFIYRRNGHYGIRVVEAKTALNRRAIYRALNELGIYSELINKHGKDNFIRLLTKYGLDPSASEDIIHSGYSYDTIVVFRTKSGRLEKIKQDSMIIPYVA